MTAIRTGMTAARVGKHLRQHRTKAGMSQADLEILSGVPKARISRYENGHVMPSIQSLDAMAACMGLTLSEFMLGV